MTNIPPGFPDNSTSDIPPRFRLSSYNYDLPPGLIAQKPSVARDESRLMVIRKNGRRSHHRFKDLIHFVDDSALIVINETGVVPARLMGRKQSGGLVELLVMDPAVSSARPDEQAVRVCMARSSKRLRVGAPVLLPCGSSLTVEDVVSPGRVKIRFPVPESAFLHFLETRGRVPLPPYIKPDGTDIGREFDRERYQTVYSKTRGSIAAPTAGLHFTEDLLERLKEKGISFAKVLLHVGPGTFIPVRHEDIRLHPMESELYGITDEAANLINEARNDGRQIIAVGTTTVRALESSCENGKVISGADRTNLFIYPGYQFKIVDNMITNFHLPGSTLLMLVAALAGIEVLLEAYSDAVAGNYMFYSYGDACLVID